ncbi:tripartite motif-containing protein 45 isoform X2 [Nematostella vectensis]|uniref:tripartite motif-containing protein 45 isoform X2 n=1 Tax=Nematostella vectensis TaxID=45351 RepID=UPI002076DC00|nr:tripartite motif-containing protein 45 isoform X2 [Nematostella vectensis]
MAKPGSKQLEDEVTCAICIEHFTDPRLLPCLHTFCRHCLEDLAEHSGKGKLVCPLCKVEYEIAVADIPSLKVNFPINNLISILSFLTSEDSDKKPVCEMCESGETSQGRCNDCAQFVCELCITGHKRMRPLQHHTIVSLEEVKSRRPLAMNVIYYCDKHKGKKLKLFCESCEEVICKDCTVVDHKNHDYLFTSDVIAREKEEILGRAKKVSPKVTDIEQAIALVEKAQEALEENKHATRRDLDAFIDKQISALEKMRADLKSEIDSACQKQEKQLTAERENLSVRLASARSSLDFAERLCTESCDVGLLSIRKEVLSQLSILAEKPVDLPFMEGGVRLVVDEEYWGSLSKNISILVPSGFEKSAILGTKGKEYIRDLLVFLSPVQRSANSQWELCYSAKRDGWNSKTFHEKCDGKAPNVVIVSVDGRYVFGGYTDVAWTMTDRGYQSSSASFLYSLFSRYGYRPEKLPLSATPGQQAIFDSTDRGPSFGGGHDLYISNEAGSNSQSYTNPYSYACPQGGTTNNYCNVFAGTQNFTPDDMEVFYEIAK